MPIDKTSPAGGARGAAASRGPRRPVQSPPLVRVMVTDALKSWVVPTLAGASAATLWIAATAGFLSEGSAVAWVGLSLLVLVLFTSLRPYFFSEDLRQRISSAAFALVWAAILFAGVYRRSFPPPSLWSGVLHLESPSLTLPGRSRYALVVDGRFKLATAQGSRTGAYRLELSPQGAETRVVEGKLQDTWAHQRLGRRGSTAVEIQRTSVLHRVSLPSASPATLRLAELDPSLEPEIRVTAYPDINPWILPALGVVGILISLAAEKRLKGDGGVVMTACVTLAVVDSYLRWGSPHPGFRDLIGAVLAGGIIGAAAAAILWRIVPRRWLAPR